MKKTSKKFYIIICLIIGFGLLEIYKFDDNKIQIIANGVSNQNPQVEVMYDGIYTCSIQNKKDNYEEGEIVTVKCQSKILPLNTHYINKSIKGLYYPDYSSVCQLIDHFNEEGIYNMVALYMKKSETGMSYFIIGKKGEEFIGYLEENMYTRLGISYHQIVGGNVLDDFVIEENKIDDLEELKNDLENNKFILVIEDYKQGITKC